MMTRDTNKTVPSGSGAPVAGLLAAWMLLAVLGWLAVMPSISMAADAEPSKDEQSPEELLKELDEAPDDPAVLRERQTKERRDLRELREERRRRAERRAAELRRRRPPASRPAKEAEGLPDERPGPGHPERSSRRSRRSEPRPDQLPPPHERTRQAEEERVDLTNGDLPPDELEPGVSDLPDVSDDELDALLGEIKESHGQESERSPSRRRGGRPARRGDRGGREAEGPKGAKGEASIGLGEGEFPKDSATGQPDLKAQQPGKPAWWQLPAEDRPYFFSWKNVKFENTCQDIEEMTGLSMIGLETLEPKPNQTISFQSVKIMSYDEALLTFNLLIQDMDCWVLKRDEYLEIRNLSEWTRYLRPERIFNSVEAYRAAKVPPWDLVSVMYKPEQRSAAYLAQRATDSVPLMVAVGTVVPQSNQVELRGFAYYVDRQLEIIKKAEPGSTDDGRILQVYELKHASTDDASRLLDELLPVPQAEGGGAAQPQPPQRGGRASRRRQQPQPQPAAGGTGSTADLVEITEDTRLRRLLVKATPANHKLVAEYLEKYIDLPFEGGESELIKLKYADPTQLVEMIRPLMGSQQVIQPPAPKGKPAPPPRVVNIGSSANLTPIGHMRAILVKGKQDEITEVKRYVALLDVEQEEAKHQYVVLEHADAAGITSMLTNLFSVRRGPRGPQGQQPFRAVNDPANAKALILTGERKDIEDAKQLIEELDVDPETGAVEHLVHLDSASPSTLGSVLQSRFGGSLGGGPRGRGGGGDALPRFIANDEARVLIVVAVDRMWPAIERIIHEIDESATVAMMTKTYQLKYAQAAMLASVLSRGLSHGQLPRRRGPTTAPLVQSDPQNNVLIVTCEDEDHKKVAELIAELDRPTPSDEVELRFIELETADADYVVGKLQELFGQGGRSPGRRSSRGGAIESPVEFVVEPVSNRILMTSSQEDYDKAVKLAQQIDADYTAQEFIRRTFILEFTEPNQVMSVIQTMFASDSSGGRYSHRSGGSTPSSIKLSMVGRGLVVLAPKSKMAEIEELIKTLDTDPSTENEIRTYKVDGVDSRGTLEIARNLGQLFAVTRIGRRGQQQSVKFIGNAGSDMLFVSAPSERMAEIDETVQEMLKSQVSEDITLVIKHYEITEADPPDVAEMVEPILESKYQELQQKSGSRQFGRSGKPQIIPHRTSRKVMVSAPKALIPLVEELIAEFDQPAEVSTMRIIALKTARAEEIAPVIMQQVGQGGGASLIGAPRPSFSRRRMPSRSGPSGGTATDLTVTPVPSSNLILLKGPQDKVFEAEQLIAELDAQARPEGPMIKVYEIEHADMYDVVNTLEEIVAGDGGPAVMPMRGAGKPVPPVVIKPELYGNKLFVSAPHETIPIIEQIIKLKESLAAPTEVADAAGRGEVISRDSDGITKIYDVAGPSDDIASYLQKILEDLLGYWEAPYVKSFPFGNKVIVTGKPEHFKMVDEWLERLEKNPPPARLALVIRRVKGGNAGRVVQMLQTYAPQDLQKNINVEAIPRLGGHKDPLEQLKEVKWDDPVETSSSQKTSPFVPSNVLNELELSLANLSWAAGPKITVAGQSATPATQPAAKSATSAEDQKPVKKTEPAPSKPSVSVQNNAVQDASEMSREDQARQAIQKAAFQAFTTRKTQIKYDEEAGLIYVVGPTSDLERLQELLDRITEQFEEDLTGEAESDIKVIPLKHLDVTIAAAILEQMFNEPVAPKTAAQKKQAKKKQPEKEERPEAGEEEGGAGRRRREEDEEAQKQQQQAQQAKGGQRIRVFPNPRDQTLVIRAAKEDFPMVAELILKIDRPSEGGTVDIQIFQLEHLNAYEVEQAIKATLKIEEGAGRSRRRRPTAPGAAAAGQAEALIEELEQQMLEMQAAAIGEKGEGKFKLNPAKDINITSDATTNTIIVNAPPDGIKLVASLIEKLEAQKIPTQIETFALEHGGAKQVAEELQKVFGSGSAPRGRGGEEGISPSRTGAITIAADERTNSLVVRALKPDMDKVKPIVKQLDVPPSIDRLVQVYPIEHGDAVQMAKTLETIFVQDPQATGKRALRITADADTNTIMVWGPELQQKIIAARIQQLEQRVGTVTTPREILLTYASPSQVAKKLETLFADRGRGSRAFSVRIEGDDNSGALYVAAPDEVFEEIKNVAQMMDKTTAQDIRIYPLQYARADEVVTQFQQMMAQLMRGLSGASSGLANVAVTADVRTNSLLVSGTPATFLAVDKILKDLDIPEKGAATLQTKIVTLKYAHPSYVVQAINNSFAKTGKVSESEIVKVTAEYNTMSLVITASADNMKKIEKMIAELDQAGTGTQQTYTIEIVNAEAVDVAATLTQIYAATKGVNVKGRQRAVFTAPHGSTKVFVTCAESEIEEIRALIAQMDTAEVAEDRDLRVVSVKRMAPNEMSYVLTEYMRRPGRSAQWDSSLLGGVKITYSMGAGAVILTGPKERLDELEQLVEKIDTAAPEEDEKTARAVRVFKLENGNSASAAYAITLAFSKPGSAAEADRVIAVADQSTNSVVVTATQDKFEDIEKLVVDLDQESGAKLEQEIVRLENARSDELAQVLATTWRARRLQPGQQMPSIAADTNSNAVVISASKTDLEGIKEMIAQLDAPLDEEDVEELRVIPLEYIDAAETREILTEYLRKPGVRAGRGRTDELVGDIRIQASATMEALIVSGSAAEIARVESLVRTMDTDRIVESSAVPQIIPVKNAPAAQLAGTLTRMFSEPAQKLYGNKNPEKVPLIMADDTTNSIVVKARNVDFNVIKETVNKLDIESTGPTGMDVVQVDRGVDIRSLAREIENTINQGERLKAAKQVGYKPAQVAIGVDERVPALLVAGSPEMFATVRQLVGTLKEMKPTGAYSAKVIPVRNISPQDMKKMLQQLIDQQSGGQKRR